MTTDDSRWNVDSDDDDPDVEAHLSELRFDPPDEDAADEDEGPDVEAHRDHRAR